MCFFCFCGVFMLNCIAVVRRNVSARTPSQAWGCSEHCNVRTRSAALSPPNAPVCSRLLSRVFCLGRLYVVGGRLVSRVLAWEYTVCSFLRNFCCYSLTLGRDGQVHAEYASVRVEGIKKRDITNRLLPRPLLYVKTSSMFCHSPPSYRPLCLPATNRWTVAIARLSETLSLPSYVARPSCQAQTAHGCRCLLVTTHPRSS